jgi:AcrR family transcriptional regulator
VATSGPGQAPSSRRDRRRGETIADIKASARSQLAEGGPAGISLRAIARQLGMTATAVHYYFPGRQALLDALIIDGCTSLGAALQLSYQATDGLPPHDRWLAVCRTHRAWALERPSEYLLVYGHAGRAATSGSSLSANRAMTSVVGVLFALMRDALAGGEIDTEGLDPVVPETLRAQIVKWRTSTGGLAEVPDAAMASCMIGYAQLHGAITLELIGRIPPQLTDRTALFELQMNHISASLNAPPPPW